MPEPVKSPTGLTIAELIDDRRLPADWAAQKGVKILDPDGWRFECDGFPAQAWDVPVSEQEFDVRVMSCTINLRP